MKTDRASTPELPPAPSPSTGQGLVCPLHLQSHSGLPLTMPTPAIKPLHDSAEEHNLPHSLRRTADHSGPAAIPIIDALLQTP